MHSSSPASCIRVLCRRGTDKTGSKAWSAAFCCPVFVHLRVWLVRQLSVFANEYVANVRLCRTSLTLTDSLLAPTVAHIYCNLMGLPDPASAAERHPRKRLGESTPNLSKALAQRLGQSFTLRTSSASLPLRAQLCHGPNLVCSGGLGFGDSLYCTLPLLHWQINQTDTGLLPFCRIPASYSRYTVRCWSQLSTGVTREHVSLKNALKLHENISATAQL